MRTERRVTAKLSRQALLKSAAGVIVVTGTRQLLGVRSSADGANSSGGQPARVNVDLSRSSGKKVQPYLYGYATGALLDDDFQLAADSAAERSARKLSPALIRVNSPVTSIIQSVFANGVAAPDWTPVATWIQHRADFLGTNGRLIFGIGPSGRDTTISPATWAEYAGATARHFREIGQEITYWEVGNECDAMGAKAYCDYFNAIADALHSVNRSYLVGGPVSSWWNGIDLPTFVRRSGTRIGFIDFHSYPVNDIDSTQTAYQKAATFADVRSARLALAGTVAARLPIGLLEYNLNGDEQPNGTWGLPAQGTVVGAVYVALLLTQAFASDARCTMGALWDLIADSNYGVIGNIHDQGRYRAIDPQGWYLSQASRLMPGQQVPASTNAANLQVLATRNGRHFAIQLVNYNLRAGRSVTVSVAGKPPGHQVARWELSARYPAGYTSTLASLGRLRLPPQSVTIVTGQRS